MAVITDLASAARILRHRGEPTEPPTRAPASVFMVTRYAATVTAFGVSVR